MTSKEEALERIEEKRKELGYSINHACSLNSSVSQSQWDRFSRKERTPSWDQLFKMADSVGIKWDVRFE